MPQYFVYFCMNKLLIYCRIVVCISVLIFYHAFELVEGWQGGSALAQNYWTEKGWVFLGYKTYHVSLIFPDITYFSLVRPQMFSLGGLVIKCHWMWICHVCRKTEVLNLLESAGFSRSNPYYVVQQGKVCKFYCCLTLFHLLIAF